MDKVFKSTKAIFILKILLAIFLGAFTVSIAKQYSYGYLNEKYYVCIISTVFLKNNFKYSNLFLDDVFMIFKNLIVFFITYGLILLAYKMPLLFICKVLLGQLIFTYIHFYPSNYYTFRTKILGIWIPLIISQIYFITHECSMSNAILVGFTISFLVFNLLIFIHKKEQIKAIS